MGAGIRGFATSLIILVACPRAVLASSPANVASEAGATITTIGAVDVRTPPCGEQPCRGIYSPDQVRSWLEKFTGEPFDAAKIESRVSRHYTFLGYNPRVDAALVSGELRVSIVEAAAVVGVVTADPNGLVAHLPPGTIESLDPADRPYIPMRTLRGRPGDLIDRERLLEDEYDLSMIGYDLVREPQADAAPDAPRRYVIVRRIPHRKWREMREAAAKLSVPSGAAEKESTGEPESAERQVHLEPLALSSIDGMVDYTRRELFTAQLTYRRINVFREFDFVEVSPYVARRLAGSIRYFSPYILPASITEWNLFSEIRLYDDFTPDRLFTQSTNSGATAMTTEFQADEERRGSKLDVGLEPFRHWNGHSLRGSVYVNRYHVGFSGCTISFNCGSLAGNDPRVPGSDQNDIDILGTSVEYTYEHLFRPPRLSWKFVPRVEVATRGLGGDLSFRRVSGELRQHYAFSTGFEIDTSWKAGVVDRRVPLFEQFSLGGPDSLRGFLRDDFLGRRFLSAQNDVWVPIPFRAMNRDSEFMAALQRNLKVSLTFDAGSVSAEDIQEVRFARGIGIGLRYSAEKSPLLIRFDAAWGYWEGVRSFYPYVSFTRRW